MTENSCRALQIWEIIDAIASRAEHRDAVSLMYTSRAFFRLAVRYVWGSHPVAAENLLKLLAGFMYRPSGRRDYFMIDTPRPLPEGYFDRFGLYAPHVRELDYHLVELLRENGLERTAKNKPSDNVQLLIDFAGSKLRLLNLERVTLGRQDGYLCQKYDLSLLLLFLPQSLVGYSVAEQANFEYSSDSKIFFNFLSAQVLPACPNIRHLSLFRTNLSWRTESRMPERLTWYSYKDFPVLENLTAIAFCSGVLNVQAIDWISKSPNLILLAFHDLESFNCPAFQRTVYPEYSFSNLRKLILNRCEVEAIVSLWNTTIVFQLEELSYSMTTDRLNQIQEFFELLAKKSRQLIKVRVSNVGSQILGFAPSNIESQSHLNLEELSLGFVGLKGSFPLRGIALVWPSLYYLKLTGFLPVEFEGFCQLPVLLPGLDYLELGIPAELSNIEHLMKMPLGMPESMATSSLMFRAHLPLLNEKEPNAMFAYLLARFFCRWWPGVQLLPARIQPEPKMLPEMYRQVNELVLKLGRNKPKELNIRLLASGPAFEVPDGGFVLDGVVEGKVLQCCFETSAQAIDLAHARLDELD